MKSTSSMSDVPPSPELPRPTAQVEPFVKVLGYDKAIEFLLTFGGAELAFPKKPTARSSLARVVGLGKAQELAQVADRFPARIPLAKPWIAAVLAAKGLPKAAIARKLHVSDTAVRRWLNTPPRGDAPPDQFEFPMF